METSSLATNYETEIHVTKTARGFGHATNRDEHAGNKLSHVGQHTGMWLALDPGGVASPTEGASEGASVGEGDETLAPRSKYSGNEHRPADTSV